MKVIEKQKTTLITNWLMHVHGRKRVALET